MSKRPPIPPAIASQLLLANRHACCVCQHPHVQIHHIDGNTSNNGLANLATLCLPHHNDASMQIGLTKKLQSKDIQEYKAQWETKCASDTMALARDRLRFYATVYKNPPRIRELFAALSREQRLRAIAQLQTEVAEDAEHHKTDTGFQWQAVPGDNSLTQPLMFSLRAGELWPQVLTRVDGHPLDSDYPYDLSPPHGMTAYHGFDLYCQLMTRTLVLHSPPIPLEALWSLRDADAIDRYAGCLVSFRERAIGKDIAYPSQWKNTPLGRVQFRVQRKGRVYRAQMSIKTMYVFSDTAAENLRGTKVCGIGVLEDANQARVGTKTELHVSIKPLLIGIGGLGQSIDGGWWMIDQGPVGDHKAL